MNEMVPSQMQNYDEHNDEIDLLELFSYYMSKLPWLIIALLIGGLIAGAYTWFLVPDRFTATSRMYMVSASSDSVLNISDLNLGTSISSDYVELMKSRPVIEEVIEDLGMDYTYEQLLGMISLSVVNNTRIVLISVTSTDPEEAMSIANRVAIVAKEQLPKVMEAPSPTIAEYAILPTRKSGPSLKKNVAVGALIGLVIMLGIFTVIFMMDDTIKTSEDVEKFLGAMPLAVIPEGEISVKTGNDPGNTGDSKPGKKSNRNKKGGKA